LMVAVLGGGLGLRVHVIDQLMAIRPLIGGPPTGHLEKLSVAPLEGSAAPGTQCRPWHSVPPLAVRDTPILAMLLGCRPTSSS
jgi:hypothetical protein